MTSRAAGRGARTGRGCAPGAGLRARAGGGASRGWGAAPSLRSGPSGRSPGTHPEGRGREARGERFVGRLCSPLSKNHPLRGLRSKNKLS